MAGMGGTGRGFRRNSDSGPDGARASQGTGTRKMGGGSWPLGRLGATPSQAWPWPPSASLSLFPTHSDPKKEGLEAQVSRLAELIGRLENKVRSLSPCLRPSTPLCPQGGQS